VAELLNGPLVHGRLPIRPARRYIDIGRFADGTVASVPGAQANILVCGPSGSGKSHLTGLLVEQWVTAGYSALIVDPEGDHVGLGNLPNVMVLGQEHLPGSQELAQLFRQQGLSIVLDLSRRGPERMDYLRTLAVAVEAERAAHGVPHWIVVDEAHQTLGNRGVIAEVFRPADLGYCLVTYLPQQLSDTAVAAMDVVITVADSAPSGGPGTAVLRETGGAERSLVVGDRRTPHQRHWRKYADQPLPAERRFRFHDPSGVEAGDLAEFLDALRHVEEATVEFHLLRGDFSRWLLGTLHERDLGAMIAAVERDVMVRRTADIERARTNLVVEIDGHFAARA
jgi:hypothetical protein